MREYTRVDVDGALVEHAEVNFLGNEPLRLLSDQEHCAVLLQDWNDGTSRVYATFWENNRWSPLRELNAKQNTQMDITGWCLLGMASIALWDYKTKQLLIFKFI